MTNSKWRHHYENKVMTPQRQESGDTKTKTKHDVAMMKTKCYHLKNKHTSPWRKPCDVTYWKQTGVTKVKAKWWHHDEHKTDVAMMKTELWHKDENKVTSPWGRQNDVTLLLTKWRHQDELTVTSLWWTQNSRMWWRRRRRNRS